MTITHGEMALQPFIEQADKDTDPYLCVHFSRQEDKFMGYHGRMDEGDALIVIKELIKFFNLSPDIVALL